MSVRELQEVMTVTLYGFLSEQGYFSLLIVVEPAGEPAAKESGDFNWSVEGEFGSGLEADSRSRQ